MRGIEDTGKMAGGMKRRFDEGFRENQRVVSQGDEQQGQGNILRLCACAVVRVRVRNKPYILLTQRQSRKSSDSTFSGMWVFPGGHVDMVKGKTEGLEVAAKREVLEEGLWPFRVWGLWPPVEPGRVCTDSLARSLGPGGARDRPRDRPREDTGLENKGVRGRITEK